MTRPPTISPSSRRIPAPHCSPPRGEAGPWNGDVLAGAPFWNAPFGAVLRYPDLVGANDAREFLLAATARLPR